jgi:hypothetical protein
MVRGSDETGGHKTMRVTIVVLVMCVIAMTYTIWYQDKVLTQQEKVIVLYMKNPCVPLTGGQ